MITAVSQFRSPSMSPGVTVYNQALPFLITLLLFTFLSLPKFASAAPSPTSRTCGVTWEILNKSANRYRASIQMRNFQQTLNPWRITFKLPPGHRVTNTEGNKGSRQTGQFVRVASTERNNSFTRGLKTVVITVAGSGPDRTATEFALNGVNCGRSGQSSATTPNAGNNNRTPGFSIRNGKLIDANGNRFTMRGAAHLHTWYLNQTTSFANLSRKGANTVRVVITSGQVGNWPALNTRDVAQVVTHCKRARLICVLELHDTSGFGDINAISLTRAAAYWKSVGTALKGQEKYVIINIGNEPRGRTNTNTWKADTKRAIAALRADGFKYTLMIDGPNWGQDQNGIMSRAAPEIFNADPQKNILFSVHMYGWYPSAASVESYLRPYQNRNLPIVVGEFGNSHSGTAVAYQSIMSYTQRHNIGWIAWSWSGNNADTANLDIVRQFNPNQVTSWGNDLINGPNGWRRTARRASVYSAR